VDLRGTLPDGGDVLAGTGFTGRYGDRPNGSGRGDPDDVLLGFDFLRISFGRVCIFSAALHALAACRKCLQWALAGVVLSVPMTWGVRWASLATDAAGLQGAGRQIAVLLFLGVRGIAERHPFLGLPAAALNATVLFLIHRAFSRENPPLNAGEK
jgi:hypothetical protein